MVAHRHLKLQEGTSVISKLVSKCKDKYRNYIVSRLNDPKTNAKTYWSVLKTFSNVKKVPIIPPLLINNNLISDFKFKANYFNDFFASQCTPLNNNSKIPETQSYVTNNNLSSVKFESKEISNVIRSLDVNKAHGHDNISIRMLRICDSAIAEPLTIIFNSCINQIMIPDIWEKSNVLFIKKVTNKLSIITDRCHYYQFVGRYLKD